jgi:hypothetical protein
MSLDVGPSSRNDAFLHHQVTGEAVGRFDEDDADAVAGNAGRHCGEARTGFDRIGATHRGVLEPVDDDEAGRFGMSFNRQPLPLFGVLAVAASSRPPNSLVFLSILLRAQ